MTTTGDVELTILDGGAGVVVVPASSVAVVISACSSGTVAQVVATRNANTLANTVGYGPGVDQAAMIIAAGGTVLFMKATTGTPGVASAVVATNAPTGTSVVTVTGTPYDAYLVKLYITHSGTIATTGIRFKISLDAGRTYGPEISLGTAATYTMTGTGIALAFAAGTLVADEYYTFGCTEPLVADAAVSVCLVALEASPYGVTGWGQMRIMGPRAGSNASTIQGYLDTMVTTKTFTRAIIEVRDNALPVAYGGSGETDATWAAAIALSYSAVSAKRICAVAGNYNMNSMFPVACAGTPRLRRNLAFALACRQAAIPPQRHAGRVKDGSLSQIIVDPTNDPADGFNYHDDYNSPSLDVARFTSARKRKGKPGFFIVNPNLMSPVGSVFTMLPLGNVMDIGCSILYQSGEEEINDDVALNDNGTIDEKEAQRIESVNRRVLRDNMFAKSMISGFSYTIDRTNNVRATSQVNFAATLFSRGYILQINGTIGFGTEG
jgi:hypothetical protein